MPANLIEKLHVVLFATCLGSGIGFISGEIVSNILQADTSE